MPVLRVGRHEESEQLLYGCCSQRKEPFFSLSFSSPSTRLAAHQLLKMLWVTSTMQFELGCRLIQLPNISCRQGDARRTDVFLKPVQLCRPATRANPRLLRPQPGERALGGRCSLLSRELPNEIY